MAFVETLKTQFSNELSLYPKDTGSKLDIKQLIKNSPDNTVFYVCGPSRMIDDAIQVSKELSIVPSNIRYERFTVVSDSDNRPLKLKVLGVEKTIHIAAGTSVLDGLLEAGLDAPFSCRTGQCKQCMVEVIEGQPEHRDSVLTDDEKKNNFCPCVSRATSSTLTIKLPE